MHGVWSQTCTESWHRCALSLATDLQRVSAQICINCNGPVWPYTCSTPCLSIVPPSCILHAVFPALHPGAMSWRYILALYCTSTLPPGTVPPRLQVLHQHHVEVPPRLQVLHHQQVLQRRLDQQEQSSPPGSVNRHALRHANIHTHILNTCCYVTRCTSMRK